MFKKSRIDIHNIIHINLFIFLCFIGGTTYAFQKICLNDGLPFWSAGIRFCIAGFTMSFYLLLKKDYYINKNTIMTALIYGLFYFAFPFGAVYWVGQYLPSGLLSVLSASVTVFAIGFNFLLKGSHTTKLQINGIFLSMIGIIIIFVDSVFVQFRPIHIICLVIALLAYLGAAFSTAFLKSKIENLNQASFNAAALLVGGFVLIMASFIIEKGKRTFKGLSLFSLLYLAIIGSLTATRITTYLMSQWNVARVTAYRFISPVISLVVGFVFFKERLGLNELIGTICIIIGAVFINKSST